MSHHNDPPVPFGLEPRGRGWEVPFAHVHRLVLEAAYVAKNKLCAAGRFGEFRMPMHADSIEEELHSRLEEGVVEQLVPHADAAELEWELTSAAQEEVESVIVAVYVAAGELLSCRTTFDALLRAHSASASGLCVEVDISAPRGKQKRLKGQVARVHAVCVRRRRRRAD
jgi:hypothetical protein